MIQRSKAFQGRLLASSIFVSAALAATPALAQDDAQPSGDTAQAAEAEGEGEQIVVTGTLVRNPNLVASSPVNVIGEDEIELQQANVAEELLRELPGAVPNIGSAVNNGQGGASYVDLRGLGSNRNIVLLDGNRLVPSDQVGRVNLNIIPVALIQRVDVLTGGASTTYGADAVSGVVNFITRRDFAGIDFNVSNQITERGDGNTIRADLTIGANFDDGRGNVAISLGYGEADAVYQGARPFSLNQVGSVNGISAGGSGTSVPTTIGFFGPQPAGQINPAGTDLIAPYAGFNFNPYNLLQTPFERFSIYGQGRYELSDALEIYGRGLFSKTSVGTVAAPSGIFGDTLTVNANNPFLPAGIRNRLCADQPFVPAGFGAGPQTITAAQCAAAATAAGPADPNYRVLTIGGVYRRTTELGPRVSDYTSQVFDMRVGALWHITDSIDLDVSGAYGESNELQTQTGYTITNRIQQALLANNATTCQTVTGGCVPLNVFGAEGSITPAQAGFVSGASGIQQNTSLAQARALISGDFGLTIPWSNEPVAFAVGGEFREYTAAQLPDSLSQQGLLGGAGGATSAFQGGYNVYEAFGELIMPIVQDRPFFNELNLEAGIRYSSYGVDAPGSPSFTTTTWKVAGTWAPIASLRFRGNYQRAVRAPNISELFTPNFTALTNLTTDPCQGAAPVGNANLTAVCIAQGATAAQIGAIPAPNAGQINVTTGGNPNLGPETASTWTAGLVFRPDFVPGLSMSVDYYHILITDAITTPTPGDVIGACFGTITAASAGSAACTGIRRNPVNGGLSGPTAGANPVRGIPGPLSNLGRLETSGIDFVINYRRDLSFIGGAIDLGLVLNWTDESLFQATPSGVNRDCVGLYSVNCLSIQPEWSWSQRTTFSWDNIDISLLWRRIDAVSYEFAPGAFTGTITGVGPLVGTVADFDRIKAYNYFDLTGRFAIGDHLTITLSVQNLLDKQPPVVGNTIGSTTYNSGNTYPSTYDTLGRRFVAAARLRF
jgi:outer membrane receptor protein involved in Fe transport